ncbi:hypothetical protein Tco_0641140 [Tanacetum coccineum]
MSSRSKFGLGFGETFGLDEVFNPSAPSIFDTTPEDVEGKPLYDRFVKAVEMHDVPSPLTGTFMPPSNKPDLDDTQLGLYNKPMWHNVANIPSFVPRVAYVPAGSRNPPASVSTGSAFPTGSRNKPTSVSAGLAVITNCTWMREDGELLLRPQQDNPHKNKDLGIIDSGCSRSMTGNKEKLDDFVKIIGGGSLSSQEEGYNIYCFYLTEIQPLKGDIPVVAKQSY